MKITDAARWTDNHNEQTHVRVKFETIERASETVDYACRDQKGRAVGGLVIKETGRVLQRTDAKGGYIMENADVEALNDDGVRYGYEVRSARDGKGFGASQHTKWFNTPEARDEALAKAVENARKRAVKKFA